MFIGSEMNFGDVAYVLFVSFFLNNIFVGHYFVPKLKLVKVNSLDRHLIYLVLKDPNFPLI